MYDALQKHCSASNEQVFVLFDSESGENTVSEHVMFSINPLANKK